ncbi:MAG: hypothetical protein H7039_08430 [Bryobacteraceae bacterium]|nr:hypothetical protein [Bryobacteraceae bacterium]
MSMLPLLLLFQIAGTLPDPLVIFLGLNPEQRSSIERVNSEHSLWLGEKVVRIETVQAEIRVASGRTDPDPLALGQRYREVESICRQVAARRQETRQKHEAILTEAQRATLRTLDEAAKLISVISVARSNRLLEGPQLISAGFIETYKMELPAAGDRFNRTDGTRIGVFPSNACSPTNGVPWVDTSEFRPIP